MTESLKCGMKLFQGVLGMETTVIDTSTGVDVPEKSVGKGWTRCCDGVAAFIIEQDDPSYGMIDYIVYCSYHFYESPRNLTRRTFIIPQTALLAHAEMRA